MKKVIVVLLALLLMSTTARADCSNGTVIKGKNGTSYCVSNVKVNWFTGFSWCDSQGMTFATLDDACPGIQLTSGCTNLVGTYGDSVWTATPKGSDTAFNIYIPYGIPGHGNTYRSFSYPVLCK